MIQIMLVNQSVMQHESMHARTILVGCGKIGELKAYAQADGEATEYVECYSYSLVDFDN